MTRPTILLETVIRFLEGFEAYGLTDREQQLTRLILQGLSTMEIADRLVISMHTVQARLRNIFTKTEVRTRRDLVTKIFFAH